MTHTYAVTTAWSGSTGVGYQQYSRAHQVSIGARQPLPMSADPSFGGDPAHTNPEELLLAAASSCQMLSFLAVAARARADVTEYVDDAEAVMSADNNPLWVNEIRLNPVITVAGAPQPHKWRRWVEIAHHECFIAQSLRSRMIIRTTFATDDGTRTVVEVADEA